jgi:molybdenum cofactor cytidylyltransferase
MTLPEADVRPRVAGLVLAAGRSLRMGGENKLTCEVAGRPMVAHAVAAACSSTCAQVLLVTGFQARRIEAAVAGHPITVVHNPDYLDGLATSLNCGLAALPDDIDGAAILLGDMPCVTAADIDRLLAAFTAPRPAIVVPSRGGRRGNPVLWPRRHFAALRAIRGDSGGRRLLDELEAEIVSVAFDSDAVFADVDTPAALAALNSR